MRDDGRVDISRARSHHESFQWREAHRHVERKSAIDHGNGATASQLERNQTPAIGKLRVELAPAAPHRFVRDAMKSVPLYADGGAHRLGHGVMLRDRRKA